MEAATRQLRRVVEAQRDGSHLRLIMSLRQMQDTTLQPLFHQLAQHPEWQVQVHAILGLAEISPDRTIDPWLVTRADPLAQEQVVLNALDLDLLSPQTAEKLREWSDLPAMARVVLQGEQVIAGQPPDEDALRKLAGGSQYQVSGLAACLLAQIGDQAPFSRYRQRLADLPSRERRSRTLWLFEVVRQYGITALEDWVQEVIDEPDADDQVVYWGVFTLLKLHPQRGLASLSRVLGETPTHRDLVRYGLALLRCAEELPPEAFDRLDGENELLRRMATAGRALATGADPTPALTALIELGHMRSIDWVMAALPDLRTADAVSVYLFILTNLERNGPARGDEVSLAVRAAGGLFKRDPQTLVAKLGAVEDDSMTQQAILLGMFDTDSAEAGRAAQTVRRIGSGRADSLALLLLARHAESINEEDLQQLANIASGGGQVSDVLQVQATWLYLKHADRLDEALAEVLADR